MKFRLRSIFSFIVICTGILLLNSGCSEFDEIEDLDPSVNIFHPDNPTVLLEIVSRDTLDLSSYLFEYTFEQKNTDLYPDDFTFFSYAIFINGEFQRTLARADNDFAQGLPSTPGQHNVQIAYAYGFGENFSKPSPDYFITVE